MTFGSGANIWTPELWGYGSGVRLYPPLDHGSKIVMD